jgi:hypothetical protein
MQTALACEWAETTTVETPGLFAGTADIVLGAGFATPAARHGFRPRTATRQVQTWRMRDVTLVPVLGLVFKDRAVVEPTRYCVYPGEDAAARSSLAGPRNRLDGRRAFAALNRPCGHYFHVLTQIIPAVASYLGDPGFSDGVLLLGEVGPNVADLLPVFRRALTLLGIAAPLLAVIKPMPPMDVHDLTFASLLAGGDDPSPFCRLVFAGMAARADMAGAAASPPMLYIARPDTNSRPLRNEEALVARLLRLGVTPVVLSRLSLDQQIMLFRHAKLIIGPHGGGLANLVFARPGAVLYELMPSHYVNPCISLLAQQQGLHYWCDIHPAEHKPGAWRHMVPWSVDIDAVERRVAEIVAAYGIAGSP